MAFFHRFTAYCVEYESDILLRDGVSPFFLRHASGHLD